MNPSAHMNPPTHSQTTEPRTVLPKEEARQGVTGHNVRYVLGGGLAIVIVAFVAIYIFYFGP